MTSKYYLPIVVAFISFFPAFAQHGHTTEKKTTATVPMSFAHVRTETLTDPELKDYKMESTVLTIAPGAKDTVSHRHDCEVFGYVLEGSVEVGLEHKTPQNYQAGQIFYEKRNIMHTLTHNTSKNQPAKILLIFIIKDGRAGYTPVYPRSDK